MKLLKGWPPLLIATVLVLAFFILPVAAELDSTRTDDGKTLISNSSYWILWDPISDHIAGDHFFMNGTTNLSAGTRIIFQFFAPTGGCRTKMCNRKTEGTGGEIIFEPGSTPGINTFSILINTTDFQANEYVFLFDLDSSPSPNPAEVDAFYQADHDVGSSVFLFPEDWRSTIAGSRLTHPDANSSYWMSLTANYTGPCYQLTGSTNLPAGEILPYSYFPPVVYGPGYLIDPVKNAPDPNRGGIVVPGEKPGINRFTIPINAYDLKDVTHVTVWNPRYNASVRSDSLSTSMAFQLPPEYKNNSTDCSADLPKPKIVPLSVMGTFAALLLFFVYTKLLKERKNDD